MKISVNTIFTEAFMKLNYTLIIVLMMTIGATNSSAIDTHCNLITLVSSAGKQTKEFVKNCSTSLATKTKQFIKGRIQAFKTCQIINYRERALIFKDFSEKLLERNENLIKFDKDPFQIKYYHSVTGERLREFYGEKANRDLNILLKALKKIHDILTKLVEDYKEMLQSQNTISSDKIDLYDYCLIIICKIEAKIVLYEEEYYGQPIDSILNFLRQSMLFLRHPAKPLKDYISDEDLSDFRDLATFPDISLTLF